jgi:hypothetical protein
MARKLYWIATTGKWNPLNCASIMIHYSVGNPPPRYSLGLPFGENPLRGVPEREEGRDSVLGLE